MNELKQRLLSDIKSKKQIEFLGDAFVFERLQKFILTNGSLFKKLRIDFEKNSDKIEKNKIFKEIVKRVREEIGIVYGSFLTQDFTKKTKILERKEIEEILKLHKSTRERIDFYEEIYSKIFEWFKPKKIGDMACGLNPISYPIIEKILGYRPKYFCSDLNPEDMKFLNKFFEKYEIKGVAKAYDITNGEVLKDKEFIDCDLVFLFKALDSFEFVKKDVSKTLIREIKAKHIVVSFATKSLVSKQDFKMERRNWFFNFIEREGFSYEIFEVENELFVMIKKN